MSVVFGYYVVAMSSFVADFVKSTEDQSSGSARNWRGRCGRGWQQQSALNRQFASRLADEHSARHRLARIFESVRDLRFLSIFLSLLFMAKCARGTDATSRANSIRFNDSGAVQPRAERLCVATATRSTLRSVHASAQFRLAVSAMADSGVVPPADDTATKLDVELGDVQTRPTVADT